MLGVEGPEAPDGLLSPITEGILVVPRDEDEAIHLHRPGRSVQLDWLRLEFISPKLLGLFIREDERRGCVVPDQGRD